MIRDCRDEARGVEADKAEQLGHCEGVADKQLAEQQPRRVASRPRRSASYGKRVANAANRRGGVAAPCERRRADGGRAHARIAAAVAHKRERKREK